MKLIYVNGEKKGQEVELKPPFISLGRESDNDIIILREEASRYHAKIEKDGNIWIIRDLGSSNGVLLNGKKISESAPLSSRDELAIGTYVFNVLEDGDSMPSSSPDTDHSGQKAGKASTADDAAQKRIRLMVVALLSVAAVVGIGVFLTLPQNKKSDKNAPPVTGNVQLTNAPFRLHYKHERSGFDADLEGQQNIFLYEASIDDKILRVRVENILEGLTLEEKKVELSDNEIYELKSEILEKDDFIDSQSLPARERPDRHERILFMAMAGARGNCVEYINETDRIPVPVIAAIRKVKVLAESHLNIPRMTMAEAFRAAEDLYHTALRRYTEKGVYPENLHVAVQKSGEAKEIIESYKKAPKFYEKLLKLNKMSREEHAAVIAELNKRAQIEERTDPEKALNRYKEILSRFNNNTDPEYKRAKDKTYVLEKKLRKGGK